MPNPKEVPEQAELRAVLARVLKRLKLLTTAVLLLTLAVALCFAAVYGQVANYFGGDGMLQGGVAVGAAALGFVLGWIARRRA
jgi:hypothetical protein